MTINVIINGANGRMGQEAVKAIENDKDLSLVGKNNHGDDLSQIIKENDCNVVVDLTTAHSVFENCQTIINANAHPVIGTSGLTMEQIAELQGICRNKQLGGIIVPNFSIGAILMMQFARQAATYYDDVEIIEMHHDGKLDSPSGTAIKTAELIAENRQHNKEIKPQKEVLPSARGANCRNIPIHSVRLPGFVAHQQVIFGGTGETLSINHQSIHRESFMPGLLLACKKVPHLNELLYGLEYLL